MQFKKITFDDMPSIMPYLNSQKYRSCDFTALGVYMWVDAFSYEFAIDNDCLFIREKSDDGYNYLAPISTLHTPKFALNTLQEHLKSIGETFVTLTLLPKHFLEEVGLNEGDCIYQREFSDYVYNAEDLKELNGRAYSKKRNLIHQFIALEPNYEFVSLAQIPAYDYERFIQTAKIGDSDLAKYENGKLVDVAQKATLLNLLAYALKSGTGELIGFCIGEVVGDVFYVHIEKADTDFKGAYQMINKLFVNAVSKTHSFNFVNREDDVGDEGLRKAKLSYNPAFLVDKYKIKLPL